MGEALTTSKVSSVFGLATNKFDIEQLMYNKYLNIKPETFKGIPKEYYEISRKYNEKS